MCLRLKLQFKFCDEQIEKESVIKEKKSWFYLNTNQIKSIAEFRNELRKRLNLSDQMSMKFLIDNFEIPSFESISIFREGDLVSYASFSFIVKRFIFLNFYSIRFKVSIFRTKLR